MIKVRARQWLDYESFPEQEIVQAYVPNEYFANNFAQKGPCRCCGHAPQAHGQINQRIVWASDKEAVNYHVVCPGDFIVKSALTHHYAVPPERFSQQYQIMRKRA